MTSARNFLFTLSCILMIVSTFMELTSGFFVYLAWSADSDRFVLLIISLLFILISAVLCLISAIKGLQRQSIRTPSAIMTRLPKACIVFSAAASVSSLINGVIFWQLIMIIIAGILFPLLFIFAAIKKCSAI